MKRIEIIFNQPLEEDILEALKPVPEASFYTLIPNVRGRGFSTPKMGDSVWPEINEIMLIYCSNESGEKIADILRGLQKQYPTEGLAFFMLEG